MGAKKKEIYIYIFLYVCVFSVATYGSDVISVGGHKKNTNLRNCSRISKQCTKPASEDEMCPRWVK